MQIKLTVIAFVFIMLVSSKAQGQEICPYFGVNLAGAEFFGTEQSLFYPTSEDLDYYKSKGIRLIRFPFSWERIQPSLGGELNDYELYLLKDLLQKAANRNMYVILDMHNYCRYKIGNDEYLIGSENVTIEHIKDAWLKISQEFKAYPNIYGYGIMNEPHDLLESTPWFSISQEIINSIRTRDTTTTIIVGGDFWSSAERWQEYSDTLKYLNDPSDNITFEAHVYFDENSSGNYDLSFEGEGASVNTGIERVQPFIDWLQLNGFKGFIGEYGVPGDDPRWLTTLDNFLNHLKIHNINGTYWAGGPAWGDYILSIEPDENGEKAQMSIVEKYISADPECTPEPATVEITFRVDMTNENISGGVSLVGSWDNWSVPIVLEENNGIYSGKVNLVAGSQMEYRFVNSEDASQQEYYEIISGECTTENGNRQSVVPDFDAILDIVCFGSCAECPDNNLIQNGNFSAHLGHWDRYSAGEAKASFDVRYENCVIIIESSGENSWEIQLVQNNLLLENQKRYVLTFDAKSSVVQTANFAVGMSSAPWTGYFNNSYQLSSNWTTYSYIFTMTHPTDDKARIAFDLGNNTDTIYFDNIVLREAEDFTISAYSNPLDAGTVSGTGIYTEGETVNLQATSNEGYHFFNWVENGQVLSEEKTYSFVAAENKDIVANFLLNTYSIAININPSNGGVVLGSGSYTHGETVTLQASANEGYSFVNWTENGVVVSSDQNYSFTASENRILTANFPINSFMVTAIAEPSEGGAVVGVGSYNYGETVVLEAIPNEGFKFLNWLENNVVISEDSILSYSSNSNRNFIARFQLLTELVHPFSESIAIFPNPVHKNLFVSGLNLDNDHVINLISSNGSTVLSKLVSNQNIVNIELGNIESGLYFIQIIGKEQVSTFKLLKL